MRNFQILEGIPIFAKKDTKFKKIFPQPAYAKKKIK
jgi:hypothetical protein